ncbi:MAG: hypothetical protein M3Q08_08295, partial [Pseudomonadota bacterium]|nr:hypothetical protein [Pseudomonadota bacterium]
MKTSNGGLREVRALGEKVGTGFSVLQTIETGAFLVRQGDAALPGRRRLSGRARSTSKSPERVRAPGS